MEEWEQRITAALEIQCYGIIGHPLLCSLRKNTLLPLLTTSPHLVPYSLPPLGLFLGNKKGVPKGVANMSILLPCTVPGCARPCFACWVVLSLKRRPSCSIGRQCPKVWVPLLVGLLRCRRAPQTASRRFLCQVREHLLSPSSFLSMKNTEGVRRCFLAWKPQTLYSISKAVLEAQR